MEVHYTLRQLKKVLLKRRIAEVPSTGSNFYVVNETNSASVRT
jgi:hypothetical protein